MHLRYRFRLYPNKDQCVVLAKTFGCARVVYNDGIAVRERARAAGEPYIRDTELQTMLTVKAKATPERAWLAEVSADALIQAIRDMQTSYRNYFNSIGSAEGGRGPRPPKFKSKHDSRQTVRFSRNGFRLYEGGLLFLAKVGNVKVRWSRTLPSPPTSVTIIKDAAGRYFASFVVDVDPQPLPEIGQEVGIDLGLTTYAALSSGEEIGNPRFARSQDRKLRKAQKALSRKQRDSKNREKARLRLARIHAAIRDRRTDWLHKQTTRLIRENQAIYLEDLAVSALAKGRLARSVHDVSWGSFRRLLVEKAAKHGRYVGIIARSAPTSQICAECTHRSGPKTLSVRSWVCPRCSAVLDRDKNAAMNILALGRKERLNACGGGVRPALARATAGETRTQHLGRQTGGSAIQTASARASTASSGE